MGGGSKRKVPQNQESPSTSEKPADPSDGYPLSSSIRNAALAVAVAIPPLIYVYWLRLMALKLAHNRDQTQSLVAELPPLLVKFVVAYLHMPLIALLDTFSIFVSITFWVISLVQGSTWLIDPYWTIIPIFIFYFCSTHPLAHALPSRALAAQILIWVWSIRLTHSYFRREKWRWGFREDWRFADLRSKCGQQWWWISFFVVYLSQEIFLIGITLPFLAVFFPKVNQPWGLLDLLATALCASGITFAYFADSQLHEFVEANIEREKRKEEPKLVLDTGLWHYSRHPNYFGEQLFWWGLALFGVNVGLPLTMVGTFINSLVLAYVTKLVEERIMRKESRRQAYEEYMEVTSVWIPWWNAKKKVL